MSSVKLEETVKKLEKRVSDLETQISEISELDTLTDEEIRRGKETDTWIKSGDKSKLIKVK